MNAVKVTNSCRFSHEELSAAFDKLAGTYDRTIRTAVRWALFLPNNETFDDYEQEALINCWVAFQKQYRGPAAPAKKSGEPRTWDDWFFLYAKVGALMSFRQLHPKKKIRIRAFSDLAPSFDILDEAEMYDLDKDLRIQRMESAIDRMPGRLSAPIKSLIKTDVNNIAAIAELGLPYNNASIDQVHWSVAVLRHIVLMESDLLYYVRLFNATFSDAIKYVASLIEQNFNTEKMIDATRRSAEKICEAICSVGLGALKASDLTPEHVKKILAELRASQYTPAGPKVVFPRQLATFVDRLHDLELITDDTILRLGFTIKTDGSKVRSLNAKYQKTKARQLASVL